MYRPDKVHFQGHRSPRNYLCNPMSNQHYLVERSIQPKRARWNFDRKFWTYVGIIFVYLSLVAIVLILVVLTLPKHKGYDGTTVELNSGVMVPKYDLDPRRRNDLATFVGRMGEIKDRSKYNSKLMDFGNNISTENYPV